MQSGRHLIKNSMHADGTYANEKTADISSAIPEKSSRFFE